MRLMLSLGLASALLAAAPAAATQYTFTIGGAQVASGTLTVQDPIVISGGSLITAITGTYNGQAITGLLGPGSYGSNNNLLYVGQPSLLDILGFSFTGAFGNRNIYGSGTSYFDFAREGTVSFSISEVTRGVPEPATWAMMLIGFGAMGVALRRRRVAVAIAA